MSKPLGHRPFIVPVFIPNCGCKHRCVFCNQKQVTGLNAPPLKTLVVRSQIDRYLTYRKNKARPVQLAFYGGNFLGLPELQRQKLLELSRSYLISDKVRSVRFSTRPDTVTPERLAPLSRYAVETIELGVQSMDDEVLKRSNRGHGEAEVTQAVALLKEAGYRVGLQMMVGLPGDNPEKSLYTARRIAALAPDFVRIYPTLVLKNSELAYWYAQGRYEPLSLEDAVTIVRRVLVVFTQFKIPVIRIGLQASADLDNGKALLGGPYHPAFGQMVYSRAFLETLINHLDGFETVDDGISFRVHPSSLSDLKGQRNENIETLKKRYCLKYLNIYTDTMLLRDEIGVQNEVIPVR